jgi:hypothetical protein
LEAFKVPEDGTDLIEALRTHFAQDPEQQSARRYGYGDPCFRLGNRGEIAARLNCPFCQIANSAMGLGGHLSEVGEVIHVAPPGSSGKFELVSTSTDGEPDEAATGLGVRIILCAEPGESKPDIHRGRMINANGFNLE